MLTEMARSQKVVTQMGNQGGSNPLLKLVQQWIDEDKIGAISKVQVWTNRPVWPQGGAFPKAEPGA
ncbi:MAG TPA: oxidoreductase, partial [Algoriphagus sp.]|nr:oxidoreductase [Algoriphagus sp.]